MALLTTCPEKAHLQRYLHGHSSTLEAASVWAHLANCETCRALVARLTASDSDGITLNEETGECFESHNTCEIEAPVSESGSRSDEASGSVHSPKNGDHTCQIEMPPSEPASASLPSLAEPRNDQTCQLDPEPPDSGTLVAEPEAPEQPGSDQTCDLEAAPKKPHEQGTLSDDAAEPPAPAAKPNPTQVLGGGSAGDGTKSLPPARTLGRPTAKTSDETCGAEPDAASARTRGRGKAPAVEGVLAGVVVPGYDILEELGRGGMGVVYKAFDQSLRRPVALKMVLAGAHIGKMGLARFRAEAEAIAQLHHANIVQIYGTGEHDGHPYFSLEYMDGGSVDQRLRESPITPRASAQLVETLARTMDFAHQHGVVHRDLKPANILLASHSGHSLVIRKEPLSSATLPVEHWSRTMVPKIGDFGLAKREDDESGQTHTGTILGTPSYMSPEQAAGKTHEVGRASDIYSLGAILYEMLTGRPPFKASSPIDTIRQVIDQEPVQPRQLEPRVPYDLETICLKCLEKEPARRYGSAAELANDLERFLNGEPIAARPTPAWERAWKWGQRRPAIVALLAVSVLALVGLITFVVWYNVSLQNQLYAAREAGKLAEEEKQLQGLYDAALIADERGDLDGARARLQSALKISSDPRLATLQDQARDLLASVDKKLQDRQARLDSADRLAKFEDRRARAQFLGTMSTMYAGVDLAAKVKEAQETARDALTLYGLAAEGDAKPEPALDAFLNDAQKAQIRADCYQLLLILAEADAQSAHPQQALHRLERARRLVKSPSRAYHLRRERYLGQLGDKAGADQAKTDAEAAVVVHAIDHFLLADEFYRRGEYDEASKEFEQVLRQTNDFWAHYLDGVCLMRQRKYVEARAQFGAADKQKRDFVWLYVLRGFTQVELEAWDAAEKDFQKAEGLIKDGDGYARYVLLVNRSVLRVRQKRSADAIADLQEAIQLKPGETAAFVNLANAYRERKEFTLAVAQIDRAVKIDPEDPRFYRLRARLYKELDKPDLALSDFAAAIQREKEDNPLLVEDLVEKGRLLLRDKKESAEALASFNDALRLQKDHGAAQRLKAEALFNLKRYKEVVEAFDRYFMENGKPLESVYRGRGLALAELGEYPRAIDDFTKVLELQQTSAVHAYRGWMHLLVEAPKLALRDFESAIQLDAKNGDAYNGRGFVHATLGQYADARKDADEAIRLGPASARHFFNAARIYAQCPKGQDRAIELIAEALRMLPLEERSAFWSNCIQKNDRALQSIRQHPGLAQIERKLLPRN